MTTRAATESREERALRLRELGGECRFLGRLLGAPPDSAAVEDAEALGWLGKDAPGLEALEVEYAGIFSVPGSDAIAAHQSVYTDVLTLEPSGPDRLGCGLAFEGGAFRGFLGGESCSEAGRWYGAAGFRPPDAAPAMADHISSELAFLGHLYLAEARACEAGLESEAVALAELRGAFRGRFLGRWVGAFAAKLAANGSSAFYGRVGRALSEAFGKGPGAAE